MYIYKYPFNLLHNKQASKQASKQSINQATVDHDAAAVVVDLWGLMKKPLL
jgi:hypothetical protein